MSIVIGITLIISSFVFAFCVSPLLVMVGTMGASDDPEASILLKILGIIICLGGIVIPIVLFISSIFLIF